MSADTTNFKRRKIAILCWFGAFVFFFLCYWWVMTNFLIPDFWDTQYALKPGLLRQRMAENPGHPLCLFMGSSRVEDGLRPALLVNRMKKEHAPLVFNFGLSGADLFREFICLKRLLESGVKPQRVGIEVIGALLHHKAPLNIDDPRAFVRARADELGIFASYGSDPQRIRKLWLRSRIDPLYEYGMVVPGEARMVRLIPLPFLWPLGEDRPYDQWGMVQRVAGSESLDAYYKKLQTTGKQFKEWFESPEITPNNDHALRQILELCKSAGLDVFLFRMPESVDYQNFYPAQANADIDSYLQRIKSEYGVLMIDARSWIGREGFEDGHHLNGPGSEKFTLRMGDELFGNEPQPAVQ